MSERFYLHLNFKFGVAQESADDENNFFAGKD